MELNPENPKDALRILVRLGRITRTSDARKAFAEEFRTEHATNQQTIVGLALTIINLMAQEESIDARNKAASNISKSLSEIIEKHGGEYLPYI